MNKKLIVIIALMVPVLAFAASTYTTNYNLEKPRDGSLNWGAAIRNNMDTIDNQMGINATGIANHLSDTEDAHDASAISSVVGSFCTSATDVQSYLTCIDAQLAALLLGGAVTITGTQNITGQKSFSSLLTASGGLSVMNGLSASGTLTFSDLSTGLLKSSSGVVSSATLVDADVSASAAITRSKLANGSANHVVINDGSGVLSSEARLALSRFSDGTSGYPLLGAGAGSDSAYGQLTATGIANGTITDTQINASAAIGWSKISKTGSNLTDIATRSHTSLTDIGTNTHAQVDSHIASTANPHSVTADQVLPSQSSNGGKYLTTNGTTASWGTVDALPSQTGNAGKYLTTNGSAASWADVSGGAYNYVINPNAASDTDDWTETDADNDASFSRDTGNTFQGYNSFAFDAADNVDKVCGDTNTLAGSFNGEASLWFKGDASLYKFEIQDGSGNVLHTVAMTNEGDWRKVSLNYPSTNGVKICVVSTGNGAAINFTKVQWGEATNLQNVSQASKIGSIKWSATTNCETSTASGSYVDLSNAACDDNLRTVEGFSDSPAVGNSDGQKLQFTYNWSAGEYLAVFEGSFHTQITSGTGSATGHFQLSDGTSAVSADMPQALYGTGNLQTSRQLVIPFSLSSSGIKTIRLQAYCTGANCSIGHDSRNGQTKITVYKFPGQAQLAVTPDTSAMSWSGNFPMASCSAAVTSASYADPTDGTCDVVEETNTNFGTVTQYGDRFGITFTPKRAGRILACFASQAFASAASPIGMRLTSTGSDSIAENGFYAQGADHGSGMSDCGIFNVTDTTAKNLWIQVRGNSGAINVSAGNNNSADKLVRITLAYIDQSLPAPVLQNQVSTSASGIERIESARINADGTIATERGDWLSGVTHTASSGIYAFAFNSGLFSDAPHCWLQAEAAKMWWISTPATTSGVSFSMQDRLGALGDAIHTIFCKGPR